MRVLAILYGLFLLGVVAAADLGALGPVVQGLHAVPLGDKVVHFLLATGLGYFAATFAPSPTHALGRARVPLASVVVSVVAALEETSQQLVPGRTFELADLAADALGLTLGTALALRRARLAR